MKKNKSITILAVIIAISFVAILFSVAIRRGPENVVGCIRDAMTCMHTIQEMYKKSAIKDTDHDGMGARLKLKGAG